MEKWRVHCMASIGLILALFSHLTCRLVLSIHTMTLFCPLRMWKFSSSEEDTPWPCCRMFDYDIFIEFNEFVNTNIAFDSERNENKHCNSTELCLSYLYRSPLFLSSLFFYPNKLMRLSVGAFVFLHFNSTTTGF